MSSLFRRVSHVRRGHDGVHRLRLCCGVCVSSWVTSILKLCAPFDCLVCLCRVCVSRSLTSMDFAFVRGVFGCHPSHIVVMDIAELLDNDGAMHRFNVRCWNVQHWRQHVLHRVRCGWFCRINRLICVHSMCFWCVRSLCLSHIICIARSTTTRHQQSVDRLRIVRFPITF